jgi:hypothetical protein
MTRIKQVSRRARGATRERGDMFLLAAYSGQGNPEETVFMGPAYLSITLSVWNGSRIN